MEQQPRRVVVTLTLETTVELASLESRAFWQDRFIGPSVAVVEVSARVEAEPRPRADKAKPKQPRRQKPGR
jgi:hypothetical protein